MQYIEDLMLDPSTPIHASVQQGHAHFGATVGLRWEPDKERRHQYELAVRNSSTEIYLVFKLGRGATERPWEARDGGPRRLIITHVGVPNQFRRQGILTRTMDELAEILQPDEIEISMIMAESMEKYAQSRGYEKVPGQDPARAPSYRKRFEAPVLA